MTIHILGVLTPLIPSLLIVWLFYGSPESKTEWFLRILLIGAVVIIFYKSGLWIVTSYHLRFFIVVLFVALTLYSFNKNKHLTWSFPREKWRRIGSTTVSALTCLTLAILTIAGGHYFDSFVNLKFPFVQGTYSVIQGGSSVMTNPFHQVSINGKYAVDLVKINKLGNRATSFFPKKLTQYHIFGEKVHSPCTGYVASTVKGLPDNIPTTVDYENSAGNHVVIECEGIKVMLAHLREDSITISKGDMVVEGQLVGEVGNSGYTDEPHLHIQANSLDGRPLAIRFGDKFLSINDLYMAR